MNDMTQVIKPKSDQLNSDDLIGGAITIKVTGVKITSTEQPVAINFEGDDGKPFKPCKSMSRVLVYAWGADAKKYVGKSMTLYRDPTVKWAGMEVGGIRISHMSHIDKPLTISLTATKQSRKPFTVQPLVIKDEPDADVSAIVAEGNEAAAKGMDAFRKWSQGLDISDAERAALSPYKAGWIATATKADESNNSDDDEEIPL